jgi:hypothetical protein
VVEAHARAPGALDDEQERALLPGGSAGRLEEGSTEGDDEPHQAREHLMHLREVHRLSGREGGGQTASIARAVDTVIRGDLEWEPAASHPHTRREVGRDGTPCPIARREDDWRASESSSAKARPRAVAGKPAPER